MSSILKLCGDTTDNDVLEKTLSTFHPSNVLLQQQYCEKGFKKYFELITCLLVAEQNNTLLMRNHEVHPTGSAPFPEANIIARSNQSETRQDNHCDHGQGHGQGYRRRRGGTRSNYRHHENKYENNRNNTSK